MKNASFTLEIMGFLAGSEAGVTPEFGRVQESVMADRSDSPSTQPRTKLVALAVASCVCAACLPGERSGCASVALRMVSRFIGIMKRPCSAAIVRDDPGRFRGRSFKFVAACPPHSQRRIRLPRWHGPRSRRRLLWALAVRRMLWRRRGGDSWWLGKGETKCQSNCTRRMRARSCAFK